MGGRRKTVYFHFLELLFSVKENVNRNRKARRVK
jgi:hypothetical protein